MDTVRRPRHTRQIEPCYDTAGPRFGSPPSSRTNQEVNLSSASSMAPSSGEAYAFIVDLL